MKEILLQIKWAYQRVFNFYDDRIYWDFADYFSQFIPAIKKFSEDYCGIDEKRNEIHRKILKLINEIEKENKYTIQREVNEEKFWSYFGSHIYYFWD